MFECNVTDCRNEIHALGLCNLHYRRYKSTGSVDTIKNKADHFSSIEERLKNYSEEDENGCWIWQRQANGNGYGKVSYNGTKEYAHRVSYILFVGSLNDEDTIHHICYNRSCINPDHLEVRSHRDNVLDAGSNNVMAVNHRKMYCSRGHLFDEDNTYYRPDRYGRDCKKCMRERRYCKR